MVINVMNLEGKTILVRLCDNYTNEPGGKKQSQRGCGIIIVMNLQGKTILERLSDNYCYKLGGEKNLKV